MQIQKHLWFWVVIAFVLAVMGVTALLYRSPAQAPADESALPGERLDQALDAATQLPTIDIQSNPLGNLPAVNPLEQANPFSDLDTNPFR